MKLIPEILAMKMLRYKNKFFFACYSQILCTAQIFGIKKMISKRSELITGVMQI